MDAARGSARARDGAPIGALVAIDQEIVGRELASRSRRATDGARGDIVAIGQPRRGSATTA
jgi:hypothetical protein